MASPSVTLRVQCGGMRWRLADTDKVEVWRGTTQLGTLTGRAFTLLIEAQLFTVEVADWLRAQLAAPPLSPPVAPRRPLAKAPSRVPFTDQDRAAQKARRRTRRKA